MYGCAARVRPHNSAERARRERNGVGPPAVAGPRPGLSCPLGSWDYHRDGRQWSDGLPASRNGRFAGDRDIYVFGRHGSVLAGRRECELHVGHERTTARNGATRSEMRCRTQIRSFEIGVQLHEARNISRAGFRGPRTIDFPGSLHDRPTPRAVSFAQSFAIALSISNSDQRPNQCTVAHLSAIPYSAPRVTPAGAKSDAVTQPNALSSSSSRSSWPRKRIHRCARAWWRGSGRRTPLELLVLDQAARPGQAGFDVGPDRPSRSLNLLRAGTREPGRDDHSNAVDCGRVADPDLLSELVRGLTGVEPDPGTRRACAGPAGRCRACRM
jgi:hypothetical protein